MEKEAPMKYKTIIYLSNGRSYSYDGPVNRISKKIMKAQLNGEDFYELHRGVFIKLSDISSLEERYERINSSGVVDINQIIDIFTKKLEEELSKSL